MSAPTPFRFPKLAILKSAEELRQRFAGLGHPLPVDDTAQPAVLGRVIPAGIGVPKPIGNRWAILPMEGWDGTPDGRPTDLVRRRWRRFGQSGAKLIWGGEAVAVRPDGRANPHQLVLSEANVPDLAALRAELVAAHRKQHGQDGDLLVGLQLTHSGRFARPHDKVRLIKHCHGYLGHEFLSAITRPGRYGGSFANRTRFLTDIVNGIRRDAPGLAIGVRLSLFDSFPFQKGPDGIGTPTPWSGPYPYAFGANSDNALEMDLSEPFAFLALLESLGIRLVCLTAASPYYNPHLQRPAMTPPSDGYLPPEDPLVGVARQIEAVAQAKAAFPNLVLVGSAYTYLQEWLPAVASAQIAAGHVDVVGLGRMVLSYPDLPADIQAGRPLQRRQVCRTFSECTTAPRNGLVSGCFPLDDFYKTHPDAARLKG